MDSFDTRMFLIFCTSIYALLYKSHMAKDYYLSFVLVFIHVLYFMYVFLMCVNAYSLCCVFFFVFLHIIYYLFYLFETGFRK